MVFTTKHHDGFCMFDTSYTDYKITNAPYGKDIVGQLAQACKQREMPLGFYYSPPDMHHPAFRDTTKLAKDNWDGEPQRPEWPLYLDYMQLQLTELLTRYGPAALIWFDGLHHQEKYGGIRFLNLIHQLQPATLVNDRIGLRGDYQTPEQFIPQGIPTKDVSFNAVDTSIQEKLKPVVPKPEDFQLWETCMTINNTWAYNMHDREFKSAQFLIRGLVERESRRKLSAERRPPTGRRYSTRISGTPSHHRRLAKSQRRLNLRNHLRTDTRPDCLSHHRQGQDRFLTCL
jgi:alpha-L-fucosidase